MIADLLVQLGTLIVQLGFQYVGGDFVSRLLEWITGLI